MRVLFIGSKSLGLAALRSLHALAPESLVGVVTIDDRDDTRSAFGDIRSFCDGRNIPCHVATDRHDAERAIRGFTPDLGLVVGWYWLLDSVTLAVAKGGFIGLHNSLLPQYRGGSPLVWAMMNGDMTVGASLFSFTEGMDDGDVWGQARIRVSPDDTIGDVLGRLEPACVKLLERVLPGILAGTAKPKPQQESRATYCAQRFPDDGELDWRLPAQAVYNAVRAQARPYPGAFSWLAGEKLTVWSAARFDARYIGLPGQVARVAPEGVYVVCGDNRAIVLRDVEYRGRMAPAREVMRSLKIRLGK